MIMAEDKINYKKQQLPLGAVISCVELSSMQLHEIIEVYHEPYFRIMRVAGRCMSNETQNQPLQLPDVCVTSN